MISTSIDIVWFCLRVIGVKNRYRYQSSVRCPRGSDVGCLDTKVMTPMDTLIDGWSEKTAPDYACSILRPHLPFKTQLFQKSNHIDNDIIKILRSNMDSTPEMSRYTLVIIMLSSAVRSFLIPILSTQKSGQV